MRVIVQPLPADPTLSADPTPTAVTTMVTLTQMPVTKPATATTKPSLIPVTVYNLAQGKFKEIPYPTRKSQEEEGPSTPAVTIPQKYSSQKLQPLLQPNRPEGTPHGQIQCQPLLTYLLKGHHGQFPL